MGVAPWTQVVLRRVAASWATEFMCNLLGYKTNPQWIAGYVIFPVLNPLDNEQPAINNPLDNH